jgi:Ca-activated chloride channel homolog
MGNMSKSFLGIIVLVCLTGRGSAAAEATGTVSGYVFDQSGNPLSGVTVEARPQPRGTAAGTHTDQEGAFRFTGLTPGRYRVEASARKLKRVVTEVVVAAGKNAEVQLIMQVATRTESVTVLEKAPIIHTSRPNVQEVYDLENIQVGSAPLHGGARLEARERPSFGGEGYAHVSENPFRETRQDALSTFAIDVDSASYANVRRFIEGGSLPPADAVRIEELINYFPYRYPAPPSDDPVGVTLEVNDCPWNDDTRLARVGLRARDVAPRQRPPSNLVFLIDVSGSMADGNKLPLVKQSLRLLVEALSPRDRVALVVYAGSSGLVLPSMPATERLHILGAIDQLEAGGSTNGGSGIQLAYQVATENFIKGGNNRVLLATDGDFNVGVTSQEDLVRLIRDKARSQVFLTVLGYGMGNLKDATMESLADKGNGNYAYIDTVNEARKVLVEQLTGTLLTVAKDVKLQVEFNPARVAMFRLIGYENRVMRHEEFDDDAKDGGEIGAGHTVTALYEIVPTSRARAATATGPADLLKVKLRYKRPDGWFSRKLEWIVADRGPRWESAPADFQFAAAVAAFGMILKGSPHRGTADHDLVLRLARAGLGNDPAGYRRAFLDLVTRAKLIAPLEPAAQSRL